MPMQKTSGRWINRIRSLREEGKGFTAIFNQLQKEDPDGTAQSPQSDKTIRKYVQEYDALPVEEKRLYRLFSWPKAMEDGALPWEASRPLLDLLAALRGVRRDRPSIRLAKWYWRAYLAAPDAPIGLLYSLAGHYTALEIEGQLTPSHTESWEWNLAFARWRSKEDEEAYLAAVGSGAIPRKWVSVLVSPGSEREDIEMMAPLDVSADQIDKIVRIAERGTMLEGEEA